jgi:DNA polymerase alpha subunit A
VRKADGSLEIDKDWYIQHQILPPISRLCAPIAGTDAQQLAFHLGLDLQKYPIQAKNADEPQFNYNYLSLEEKFADCDKLSFKCSACNVFSTVVGAVQKDKQSSMFCANCGKTFDIFYISNQLTRTVRQMIDSYYKMNLVCTEPSCAHESRQLLFRKRPMCTSTTVKCNNVVKQEVEAATVYNQLLYFRSLFDVKTALAKEPSIKIPPEHNELFRRCFDVVDRVISQSAYNQVSLKAIMSYYSSGMQEEQHENN